MITETADKNSLLTALDEPVSEMLDLASKLPEDRINQVPYKDSWTAGQLLRHVTKSVAGIGQAIGMEGKPADRDPGEKIAELKKTFLDYTHKLQSPDFIIPEAGPYQKERSLEDLKSAVATLKENAAKANLPEVVEGLPLGPITKLELLHFVVYHTMRHLHQLHKISDALQTKQD